MNYLFDTLGAFAQEVNKTLESKSVMIGRCDPCTYENPLGDEEDSRFPHEESMWI